MNLADATCPACGGSGGGPLGRAGGAWDDEDYVCPRCDGEGYVSHPLPASRPGIAKGVAKAEASPEERKRAQGGQ